MPDNTSGLIWVQTVWHSDDISEIILKKVIFENKSVDKEKH